MFSSFQVIFIWAIKLKATGLSNVSVKTFHLLSKGFHQFMHVWVDWDSHTTSLAPSFASVNAVTSTSVKCKKFREILEYFQGVGFMKTWKCMLKQSKNCDNFETKTQVEKLKRQNYITLSAVVYCPCILIAMRGWRGRWRRKWCVERLWHLSWGLCWIISCRFL